MKIKQNQIGLEGIGVMRRITVLEHITLDGGSGVAPLETAHSTQGDGGGILLRRFGGFDYA